MPDDQCPGCQGSGVAYIRVISICGMLKFGFTYDIPDNGPQSKVWHQVQCPRCRNPRDEIIL